jgi:hypothetical protein
MVEVGGRMVEVGVGRETFTKNGAVCLGIYCVSRVSGGQ